MRFHNVSTAVLVLSIFTGCSKTVDVKQTEDNESNNPYVVWENGPSHNIDFFPIAVWLQNPSKAGQYLHAGINTYVGLWQGPTESQLVELKKAGMKVICDQNTVGLNHIDDPVIIAWMHGDEPDNAQSLGEGQGYGPPITPQQIVQDYEKIRQKDPSRPVLLNLGQGVAWDQWYGRGVRTNHPEDYPEYLKGCDICSFDIYPVVHSSPAVAGKLYYVAEGVQRLVTWSEGAKIVWNCIECTRINNPTAKPTPYQVRSEVWMSIIHGSMGLIYFVHEWEPVFNESALLSDPEMLSAVTDINEQITRFAPVLNSPTIEETATVSSDNKNIPVAALVKRYVDSLYLFAAGMRDGGTVATFSLEGFENQRTIEVIDEDRTIIMENGTFKDQFKPYEVHIYRVKEKVTK